MRRFNRLVEQVGESVPRLSAGRNVGFSLPPGLKTHKRLTVSGRVASVQLLRHIADARIGLTLQRAGGRFDNPAPRAPAWLPAPFGPNSVREYDRVAGWGNADSTLRLPGRRRYF